MKNFEVKDFVRIHSLCNQAAKKLKGKPQEKMLEDLATLSKLAFDEKIEIRNVEGLVAFGVDNGLIEGEFNQNLDLIVSAIY